MEEYLFGDIPEDLNLGGKRLFYFIRLSDGMIIFGVFVPWLTSRAFGAEQSGWDLAGGKLIVAAVLIGATVGYLHLESVPLSRVALGASFVGVITFNSCLHRSGHRDAQGIRPGDRNLPDDGRRCTAGGAGLCAALAAPEARAAHGVVRRAAGRELA
jgi:hypothetical protein